MKKLLIIASGILFLFSSCESFLDIEPRDKITDDAVWSSASATSLFVNNVYGSTLTGPLYNMVEGCNDWWSFDHGFTDDMGVPMISLNEFSFTPSNIPQYVRGRWDACYANIRKTNLALEKLGESTVLNDNEKRRYMGDMYFLRGLNYLELWRFWGGVPMITKPLNSQTDDIFYPRSSSEDIFELIVSDFDSASVSLPGKNSLPAAEYGRATKGAALGFKVVAYLHAAGVLDEKYYADAANTADIFISGELSGQYDLFGKNVTDPAKKAETFANIFLEPYEGHEEVIFDVQYQNPHRHQKGYQTIAAPGIPGKNNDYGWGFSAPSQMIVDAFEMTDGSEFDWNNPEHAKSPYVNRDARFYASILYDGVTWKDTILSLSSNRWVYNEDRRRWMNVTDNLPNGLYSSKVESTKTGYFIRKHQNESVICGTKNRYNNMDGEGGNLIVLRYAEILLTYAEARNEELKNPDASVYAAINAVRNRAGQPDLPAGLGYEEMKQRIRNERRIELAFENKRYFDIIRWREGLTYLNQPFYRMEVKYVLENNQPVPTYNKVVYFEKKFDPNKNYLFPIPQHAINRNPMLEGDQNPGW